ncbi:DUF1330 domain-containing protein [Changchengzhania lutea]|uniref:DUF1330 domain-containing protein n=1 Tax=Changchengzhania lutea TaxID=2049305 RepID=UPI00115F4091|nr:DUF1330 domain-containing protein [Changchengzhania lutea]
MKKLRMTKLILFTMIVSVSNGCSANQSKKENNNNTIESTAKTMKMEKLKENKGVNYSIVLLTIQDNEKYNRYRKATEKVMKKAGGHIERDFDVMGQKGNIENFEAPNRVVVIYWDTPNGHEQLMNNEKYKKESELLKSSTSNIRVIKGTSEMFQSSDSDENGRMYLMKISYYKENTAGRIEMLQKIGPKLAPYGFYTERMIMANEAKGIDIPNEVTIHFHDFSYQNEELQKDESVKSAIGEYNNKYLTHFVYLPLKLR